MTERVRRMLLCELRQRTTSKLCRTSPHQMVDIADSHRQRQVDFAVLRQSRTNDGLSVRALSALDLQPVFLDVSAARTSAGGRRQASDPGTDSTVYRLRVCGGQRERIWTAVRRDIHVTQDTEAVAESVEEPQSAASNRRHVTFQDSSARWRRLARIQY